MHRNVGKYIPVAVWFLVAFTFYFVLLKRFYDDLSVRFLVSTMCATAGVALLRVCDPELVNWHGNALSYRRLRGLLKKGVVFWRRL